MRKYFIIVLAAFVLVVTACGSSSTAVEAADAVVEEGTETPEEGDGTATVTTSDEGEDEWESPIMDALGVDFGSFDNDIDFEQIEQDRQFDIQACMQDLGFEYTPVDFGEVEAFGPIGDPDVEWGTQEFAEKYGYGISTFIEDEIAMIGNFDRVTEDAYVDPNADYVTSLPEAAQEAYREALYGQEPSVFDLIDEMTGQPLNPDTGEAYTDQEIDEALNNFEPSGCQYVGQEDFGRGEEGQLLDAFEEEFGNMYEDFYERVQADPRILASTDEWVRCMADKSHSFADRNDTFTAVQEQMEPIYQQIYNFGGPPVGLDVDEATLDAMSDEEREEYFSDFQPSAPTITPELQAEIDRISAYEISVATADFACSADINELMRQVEVEYEERFVQENQAAITVFLERQAAASEG